MFRSFLLILSIFFLSSLPVHAQEIEYETREVITGTNIPWEIRWGHDGWIWFTERNGRFSRVNPETGERKVLLDAPTVLQLHESGMLGFDFHPDFPDSPYIYIAFTHQEQHPARLELFRYKYSGDSLLERTTILGGMKSHWMHVGCRVVIHDRKIYLSVGEVADAPLAQDTSSRNGKILRVNLDGSIPTDNPYSGNALWSYGHRNPQGLVFAPSGILYSGEHGASTDDELNIIQKGHNYGWPIIEGFCDKDNEAVSCDSTDLYEPLYSWTSTLGTSGMDFYSHDSIPEWRNAVLVAALKDQSISVLKLDEFGQRLRQYRRITPTMTGTTDRAGRLRDICISPGGRVFISTSNTTDNEDPVDVIFEMKRVGVHPYWVSQTFPDNQATVVGDSAVFRWNSTAADSRYHFQLATEPDFYVGNILSNIVSDDTTVTIQSLPLDHPQYFWRVREETSKGDWSSVRSFSLVAGSVESVKPLTIRVRTDRQGLLMELPEPRSEKSSLRLVDVLGNTRHSEIIGRDRATVHLSFDSFANGPYYVVVETGSERVVERIMINR